jgi:type IV secretion system protein VirB8
MIRLKKKDRASESIQTNWYADKYEFVRQQRDMLSVVTVVSLLLAAASVLTVMWLTPYKSVEPFVIQIDDKTGQVQKVDPVQRSEFTANEAIDRYFVAQYIRAREGYVAATFPMNYQTVRVMSAPHVFRDYARAVARSNPQSPINTLTTQARRVVVFKNINFARRSEEAARSARVVIVRVLLRDESEIPSLRREFHGLITMQFRYANLSLSEEDRFLNPIGMLVEDYQMEQEVVQ